MVLLKTPSSECSKVLQVSKFVKPVTSKLLQTILMNLISLANDEVPASVDIG
jgi:hypothetical protein